jgi:hypothetical protein
MKFFVDSSFLGNAYYPKGAFFENARRVRHRLAGAIHYTEMVRLEFRLGSLWKAENLKGWHEFVADEAEAKAVVISLDWNVLLSSVEPKLKQYGRKAKPDLLDTLHVLSAVQWGATHFLSYDQNSRQRSFARACGLKVLPEKLSGELT